jgi:hypothetical protein
LAEEAKAVPFTVGELTRQRKAALSLAVDPSKNTTLEFHQESCNCEIDDAISSSRILICHRIAIAQLEIAGFGDDPVQASQAAIAWEI